MTKVLGVTIETYPVIITTPQGGGVNFRGCYFKKT